jgi:hypothetical protein
MVVGSIETHPHGVHAREARTTTTPGAFTDCQPSSGTILATLVRKARTGAPQRAEDAGEDHAALPPVRGRRI